MNINDQEIKSINEWSRMKQLAESDPGRGEQSNLMGC
jgi:hypothetical protein